jgi:hypothetical protein
MNSLEYNGQPVQNIENCVVMFLQKYGIKPFNLTFQMDIRGWDAEDWKNRLGNLPNLDRTMSFEDVVVTVVDGYEVKIPAAVKLFKDRREDIYFLRIKIPMSLE